MFENVKAKFEELSDKVDDFTVDHPTAYAVILTAVCTVVAAMPLCVAAYKYQGYVQEKAMAKELLEAGVKLGYTHD